MKFFLINKYIWSIKNIDNYFIVNDINNSNSYNFKQFIFNNLNIKAKTIYIWEEWNVYCFDISLISKIYHSYFFIWNVNDSNIQDKIIYFFGNLSWIFLHTLSLVSKLVWLNKENITFHNSIFIKDFLLMNENEVKRIIFVNKEILLPDNLVVTDKLYSLYNLLEKKLLDFYDKWEIWNIFFEDFILSLLPEKYWVSSIFFLNSKLKLKISNFFNKYNEIISLHIPVARSKYLEDLFWSLILQKNKNFKIFLWVDWYNKKQKDDIVKIVKKYENKFDNFSYFVNRINLWVWKTRWKLLNWDKKSKYIVFLDDDNFLSINAIELLYKKINEFPKCWMYSIPNIDVRYDIDYKDYINNYWPFSQPFVYTNRERVSRLPLYCDQEETPLIHNRFYSDLMDIKYHETFDSCSVDMVYNRFLEVICWNINFDGLIQFMRVWHQFHQTRSEWFNEKEFKYVMYILKTIAEINNNIPFFTYLIKTNVPKQNELFTKE